MALYRVVGLVGDEDDLASISEYVEANSAEEADNIFNTMYGDDVISTTVFEEKSGQD